MAAQTSPRARSSPYSLPVKARMWPLSTNGWIFSTALRASSTVQLAGSMPMPEHDQPQRVAHLREHGDVAREGGVEDVVHALQLAPGELRVVADAGQAGLPDQAVLAARVEGHVLEVLAEVHPVRDVLLVQLLHVAQPDQPARHPVRQDDDVAADALAAAEGLADLGEELVVVVDVLGVGDADAGLVLEVGDRIAVDVVGPVRDAEGVQAAAVRRRRRPHRPCSPGRPPSPARPRRGRCPAMSRRRVNRRPHSLLQLSLLSAMGRPLSVDTTRAPMPRMYT